MIKIKVDVNDISPFYGFFFIMNDDPTINKGPGIVGSFITSSEIEGKSYSVGVYGPTHGWNRQDIFAHEAIHSYGIKHSSHPDSFTVIPNWDVMGGGGACDPPHSHYGCLAIHTIAWHKLLAGWIDLDQDFHLFENGAGIVTIENLEFPLFAVGNYLMADITNSLMPVSQFYTVEYRRRLGYDAVGPIPGDAVIIHNVDWNRTDNNGYPDFFAQVIDSDNNGNPNDDGAMWLPGETFLPGYGVIVHIESMDDEAAVISLSNLARDPVYADKAFNGLELGTITAPWNTVVEAYSSVLPSGTVYIQPGIYHEKLRLTKACKLKNVSSNMSVIIGQ